MHMLTAFTFNVLKNSSAFSDGTMFTKPSYQFHFTNLSPDNNSYVKKNDRLPHTL